MKVAFDMQDPQVSTTLKSGIQKLGLNLSDDIQNKLLGYVELLIKWNKAYNLTAITDSLEIVRRHILDSLSIVPYISGKEVLDVGSGAGLPGIPCALALPEKNFTLLDSNGKKTRFITQVLLELSIPNITVIQSRVETYRPQGSFDAVLVRAFSSIDNIVKLTDHLLSRSGELLIMKGVYPYTELQKINNHVKVYRLSVPGLNEERHLVTIKGLANE